MAVATLDELKQWFNGLEESQRVCRTMTRTEDYSAMCGRAAVGMDRLNGPRGLVCEAHKPQERWFVRLRQQE
jgi:hypothetical protein